MGVFDRRRLTFPLAVPCLGGLIALYVLGAPLQMVAINTGALILALVWILLGRLPTAGPARLAICTVMCGLLFLPLLTGPELGGVSRWLPAGPVTLHTGPLVLPLIAVLATEQHKYAALVFAAATIALALQPDAASLLALGLAAGVLAITRRDVLCLVVALAAFGLAAFTFEAGSLEPQPFVESVIADMAERSLIQAGGLVCVLCSALWCFLADPQIGRDEGRVLAAILTGFTVMASLGPFPYPLIAYGASPILGFGLALGALPRKDQLKASALMEIVYSNR